MIQKWKKMIKYFCMQCIVLDLYKIYIVNYLKLYRWVLYLVSSVTCQGSGTGPLKVLHRKR